jgi:hypothetical protein
MALEILDVVGRDGDRLAAREGSQREERQQRAQTFAPHQESIPAIARCVSPRAKFLDLAGRLAYSRGILA